MQSHSVQDGLVRQRFEALTSEISDLLAVKADESAAALMRKHISSCRKAAYALLAYAGPELAKAAIDMTIALDAAFSETNTEDMASRALRVHDASAALSTAFLFEVVQHRERRNQALESALDEA